MTLLSRLPKGRMALITGFSANQHIFLRFMEMGLGANERIQMLGQLPFGGNLVILSYYGKYTLRKTTAQMIQVKEL